jgi:hypothetical protein
MDWIYTLDGKFSKFCVVIPHTYAAELELYKGIQYEFIYSVRTPNSVHLL